MRVIIEIEGGLVLRILSDQDASVLVIDRDVQYSEEGEIRMVPSVKEHEFDHNECFAGEWNAENDLEVKSSIVETWYKDYQDGEAKALKERKGE